MSTTTATPISTLDPSTHSVASGAVAGGSSILSNKWFIWPLVAVAAGTFILWVINPKIVRKYENGECTGKPDIIKCLVGGLLFGAVAIGVTWLLGNRGPASAPHSDSRLLSSLLIPAGAVLLVILALWWMRPSIVCIGDCSRSREQREVDWIRVILGGLLVGGVLFALLYATGFCR